MSRIKILPESLANQIAAGEVVERPAAVVKELLENAIDAGATMVDIHVEGAGTRSIRIVDNGIGMDQDDILLSLERHATSKLTSVDQLSSITTLGFRGEAIPSIASVSKVTITSRLLSAELGSTVYVHFGSIKKVHEMGCATGTMIEVRDLFGNVPARRKFLKSAATELAHIDEVVRSYCLANPHIGFTYHVGGKAVLQLLGKIASVKIRFQEIIGHIGALIELAKPPISPGMKVSGFLVPPDQASGKTAKLWTFVNGRYVKDRLLSHAVLEGMQGFMMKGRRPGGVVFVDLDPPDVDVNVHPTKQEVRFRNSGGVHQLVSDAVAAGLKGYQQQLRQSVFGPPASSAVQDLHANMEFFDQEKTGAAESLRSVPERLVPEAFAGIADGRRPDSIFKKPLFPEATLREPIAVYASALPPKACDEKKTGEYDSQGTDDTAVLGDSAVAPRFIGQLFGAYILCEIADGLVVVDQHAAQERLFFEELRGQYANSSVPSQTLLFPEMIDLTAAELSVLEQFAEEIRRLGLDVQGFGGDTYVVNAIPASMAMASGEEVLREIIGRFMVDGDCKSENRIETVLAGMACKAAIKAGHRLCDLEIESLLLQLQRAGVFSHCPHGRPVVKRFSDKEVRKWFYRT
jgi:DNA mismatch repair protein MutL